MRLGEQVADDTAVRDGEQCPVAGRGCRFVEEREDALVHLKQASAAQDVLLGLRSAARAAAASSKDTVGVVHAGLAVLQRQLQAAGQVWTAGEKRGRGYDAEAAAGTAVRTKHRNAVIF